LATTALWFRRDLRVHDHPALRRALDDGDRVAPLFVVDDRLLAGRWQSANRTWFLAGSVAALATELQTLGVGLTIVRGDPRAVVPEFARAMGAARVLVTADHAPYGRRRDDAVAVALERDGIAFTAEPGLLVHEPDLVRRADGGAYSVFGPFHRSWSALGPRPVLPAPARIAGVGAGGSPALDRSVVDAAFGRPRPTANRDLLLAPGELAARARLDRWADSPRLADYADLRDRLDLDGTSRLSQDLRFGLISPVEVLERCAGAGPGPARFATEIAWRDFYAGVLARTPRVLRSAFRPELDTVQWASDDEAIAAWKQGRTGFPVVDAAMRQLVATGWMHNRARMIVASFLAKDLLADWRIGEAFFMEHLVDGDPASNDGGWQWAASTGTDPQPYFRVFNPALQGRRHDPDGTYVRRWVPELADVAAEAIHDPAPETRLARGYPAPIVSHREARLRAIAAFEAASASGRGAERDA
jgi:deoxyribodipyrimidine photo-lyase